MAPRRRAETMEENRAKLIAAGRKAFAEKGFAAASMDELTAEERRQWGIQEGEEG